MFIEKDDSGDTLPAGLRHIRIKERKVRPEFYQTCAALTGIGLSILEASAAVIVVGSRIFGGSWKNTDDQ